MRRHPRSHSRAPGVGRQALKVPLKQAKTVPLPWQVLTVALMVIGYAGYYLCRSDLSVALPLLIDDMGKRGIPPAVATVSLGTIASLGVLAYAIGKFPSGWLADFLGGRRNFLFGMGGSILFTVLFGLAVHARLDRQSFRAVPRLGGDHQDYL